MGIRRSQSVPRVDKATTHDVQLLRVARDKAGAEAALAHQAAILLGATAPELARTLEKTAAALDERHEMFAEAAKLRQDGWLPAVNRLETYIGDQQTAEWAARQREQAVEPKAREPAHRRPGSLLSLWFREKQAAPAPAAESARPSESATPAAMHDARDVKEKYHEPFPVVFPGPFF